MNPILIGARCALKQYPIIGYIIKNGIALPVHETIVYRDVERITEKEKKVYIREPCYDNVTVVRADYEGWTKTGFTFYVNDIFVIDVCGIITIDGGKTWIDSNGVVVKGKGKGTKAQYRNGRFPDYPLGCVVGRVSSWIFQVKSGEQQRCENYGEMNLTINDTPGCYKDNVLESRKTAFWVKIAKVRK